MEERDALRPKTLKDFKGQPNVSHEVGIIVKAANMRDELCDHILLAGGPGLGKTTLAHIIAKELNAPITTTSGPAIERPGDVAELLTNLRSPGVVFIDEIHRIPRTAEELLYSAMEDGVLDVRLGEGPKARSIPIKVTPFTLIGATTQAGMLSAPMRDRFGFTARVELYTKESLTGIVNRSASLLNLNTELEGRNEIAKRSKGTPRIANNLLRRVRDWAQVNEIKTITGDVSKEALEEFGIDELGLDRLGRKILETLCDQYKGKAVGLKTIAASVGESTSTIEEAYEPFFMHKKLIARTPQGRVAAPAAWEHLGLEMPTGAMFYELQEEISSQLGLELET